jgi:hypothetical protein
MTGSSGRKLGVESKGGAGREKLEEKKNPDPGKIAGAGVS